MSDVKRKLGTPGLVSIPSTYVNIVELEGCSGQLEGFRTNPLRDEHSRFYPGLEVVSGKLDWMMINLPDMCPNLNAHIPHLFVLFNVVNMLVFKLLFH